MGKLYLTWLADELRAAGLRVVEYDGWPSRARSSGGYDAAPLGVSWHHTASSTGARAKADCDYMVRSSDARPTCNVYIPRNVDVDGDVWLLAAGATNTSGKGGPLKLSRGTVGTDKANTTTVGMEIGNNGVGEPYSRGTIDAAFTVSNVINRRLGNTPADLFTHNLYAPTRKIDPATAAAVAGPWRPRSVTSSGTWSTDDIRAEAITRATHPPVPEPEEEPDMVPMVCRDTTGALFGVSPSFARFSLWGEDYNALVAAGCPEVTFRDDTLARMPYIGEPIVTKPILE